MRKKWKSWIGNILIFLVLVQAVEWFQSRNLVRGALPEFMRMETLPLAAGGTQSLWSPESYTVVYAFAPWCGVCRMSGSNIEKVPAGFRPAGLALSWEKPEEVQAFIKDAGLQGPVMLGGDREAEALQIGAFPSYFIIDKEGRVVKAWSGYTTIAGLWVKAWLARIW